MGSAVHLRTLSFHLIATPADLGHNAGFTPMSTMGAGSCSGNIASIPTGSRTTALHAAQRGKECMAEYPFDHRRKHRNPLEGEATMSNGNYAARYVERACRLCGHGNESIWHLALECTSVAFVRNRATLWASTLQFMERLFPRLRRLAERTLRLDHGATIPGSLDADETVTKIFLSTRSLPAPAAEHRFLLYWLLMASPWTARVASHPGNW
jgi:hypothetical protein